MFDVDVAAVFDDAVVVDDVAVVYSLLLFFALFVVVAVAHSLLPSFATCCNRCCCCRCGCCKNWFCFIKKLSCSTAHHVVVNQSHNAFWGILSLVPGWERSGQEVSSY